MVGGSLTCTVSNPPQINVLYELLAGKRAAWNRPQRHQAINASRIRVVQITIGSSSVRSNTADPQHHKMAHGLGTRTPRRLLEKSRHSLLQPHYEESAHARRSRSSHLLLRPSSCARANSGQPIPPRRRGQISPTYYHKVSAFLPSLRPLSIQFSMYGFFVNRNL